MGDKMVKVALTGRGTNLGRFFSSLPKATATSKANAKGTAKNGKSSCIPSDYAFLQYSAIPILATLMLLRRSAHTLRLPSTPILTIVAAVSGTRSGLAPTPPLRTRKSKDTLRRIEFFEVWKANPTMLVTLAAAAAALSVPNFGYEDAVFVRSKLERVRELRSASAAVTTELWIGPDGHIFGCKVVTFVGPQAISDSICELLHERRFKAPRGPSGAPVYAVSRIITAWGSTSRATETASQELSRQSEPDRVIRSAIGNNAAKTDVRLTLAIDPAGHAIACRPVGKPEKDRNSCDLVKDEQFTIMRDTQAQPVTYVRIYWVRYEPEG